MQNDATPPSARPRQQRPMRAGAVRRDRDLNAACTDGASTLRETLRSRSARASGRTSCPRRDHPTRNDGNQAQPRQPVEAAAADQKARNKTQRSLAEPNPGQQQRRPAASAGARGDAAENRRHSPTPNPEPRAANEYRGNTTAHTVARTPRTQPRRGTASRQRQEQAGETGTTRPDHMRSVARNCLPEAHAVCRLPSDHDTTHTVTGTTPHRHAESTTRVRRTHADGKGHATGMRRTGGGGAPRPHSACGMQWCRTHYAGGAQWRGPHTDPAPTAYGPTKQRSERTNHRAAEPPSIPKPARDDLPTRARNH